MSDGTFRYSDSVKPAPRIPAPPFRLYPSFAHVGHEEVDWLGVQIPPCVRGPLFERLLPLYPGGPWLRVKLCCLDPSLLNTTPCASPAGTLRFRFAYTQRLRCAGAPRRPAGPSACPAMRAAAPEVTRTCISGDVTELHRHSGRGKPPLIFWLSAERQARFDSHPRRVYRHWPRSENEEYLYSFLAGRPKAHAGTG